jgi:hypothetical protein
MFNVKLAKSIMENEEGMNHLWIQLFPDVETKNAEIDVQLPDGIHRLHNLNGYVENESKHILLDLTKDKDVLIELFTQDPITYGTATIVITLIVGKNELIQKIPIYLVTDDEMEGLVVNQKKLLNVLKN